MFACGEKAGSLKTARKVCAEHWPQAKLMVWPGKGHCNAITDDPSAYAALLLSHLNSGE